MSLTRTSVIISVSLTTPRFRHKKLIETTPEDFLNALKAGGVFTPAFFRCVHNWALGLGWLPWPILPHKLWPDMKARKKRGIAANEHQTIITSEKSEESRTSGKDHSAAWVH